MGYPPGTIIIACGELSRYTKFSRSLSQLAIPEGTLTLWSEGVSVAANLNRALEKRIGEWVWFLGDDHTFAPDLLYRLLNHGLDAVVPLVLKRKPPCEPVIYKAIQANGWVEYFRWDEIPASGVFPIAAAGAAGLLVRARVLEKLDPPYFAVGQVTKDQLSEDLWFCRRLQEAGIPLYVDLDTMMGHITPIVLSPVRIEDGRWAVDVDFDNGTHIQFPIEVPPR